LRRSSHCTALSPDAPSQAVPKRRQLVAARVGVGSNDMLADVLLTTIDRCTIDATMH